MVAVALAALVSIVGCRVIADGPEFEREGTHLFKTGPYVVLSNDGPRIVMRPHRISVPVVEWWVADPDPDRRELLDNPSPTTTVHTVDAQPSSDLYVAKLEGARKTDRIAYRVKLGERQTATYRFRAGAAEGERFRFAVFGDTRTGHAVHAAVVDAMDKERLDFVLHTGDMVYRGGVREMWDQFFAIERPLLVDTPMFPAVGNHDLGRRRYFERYFLLAERADDRRFYHYDWGNVRLIALDGDVEGREGSSQFGYARWACAEASARGMHIVLFLHWPPYSSGSHGSQLDIREPIAELAERYGVELVVTGHDHMYERTVPIKGTTYIVSGSAGAPARNFTPSWFTAHARTDSHYVLVDVEGDRLIVRAVSVDGTVFDSTVIPSNPIGGPTSGPTANK